MTPGSFSSSRQNRDVPIQLRRFVQLFNRERFWESHEVLEDSWRRAGSEFYHGLILYASAFVHVLRGNANGTLAQLDKAERALTRYRPAYLGIDIESLMQAAERCRRVVARQRNAPSKRLSELIDFPQLGVQVDLIRGDEPELVQCD